VALAGIVLELFGIALSFGLLAMPRSTSSSSVRRLYRQAA
jgi:hypothetical protein